MSGFNPRKLTVTFIDKRCTHSLVMPRCYTLTHSDRTGDLFLSIGTSYDQRKLYNWYTKLMRDEVLGEWEFTEKHSLHIHCHVSGGFVIGPAKWRMSIFLQHLPMVLQAICYGDKTFLLENQHIQEAPIYIHFHAKQKRLNKVEQWGNVKAYL